MTEYELKEPYAGLAPGSRFALVRKHQFAPFLTLRPLNDPTRGYTIPLEKLQEIG